MKKLIITFIFLGILLATFCTSGWMAHTMNNWIHHGSEGGSECCDYETKNPHIEQIAAMTPLQNDFVLPVLLLALVLAVVVVEKRIRVQTEYYLPFYFHRFSRGVFQLE